MFRLLGDPLLQCRPALLHSFLRLVALTSVHSTSYRHIVSPPSPASSLCSYCFMGNASKVLKTVRATHVEKNQPDGSLIVYMEVRCGVPAAAGPAAGPCLFCCFGCLLRFPRHDCPPAAAACDPPPPSTQSGWKAGPLPGMQGVSKMSNHIHVVR